ncbi:MAG: MATE family efflux transporter [Candidatus Pseudobacter hemicellulosilyticus]|uniref:Multidrug-efflux transporter n=1 Tax=Candidatus Pseudobacter hemicellulosilyticus TaxID=3121375 RepID=A0AAJ6BE41_9BACT|nr:MAG: MATE family efflux transporter [Pseudobacter sp.]
MQITRQGLQQEASATIRLAVPIIIGELAQMSLHIIDAAMVGALGYKQLAAVSLVLNSINIPFIFGIGLTIAVSQMVSMANGRRDGRQVSHYLFNGFWLCTAVALLISVGILVGINTLYHLGQDPEVVELAIPFGRMIALSLIPSLLFMTLKQFADGLEHTAIAMVLSLVCVPVNILLNWLLIYGHWGFPRLELIGAGWATLITRTLIFFMLLFVVLYHHKFRRYMMVRRSQWKLSWKTQRELLHIGVASSLQMGLEAGAFAVSGIIIGTMGAIPQAAHQIALSMASLTFMVSIGLAQAGSIRVSNAYGRGDWHHINRIGRSTLFTALVYGGICVIGITAFRFHLPYLFNDNDQVVQMAALLLLFAAIFQISDSTQAVGAGLNRGIKDVKVPTLLVAIAYWVIGIPVGYLLAFHWGMGATGIWLGFIVGLSFASIFMFTRFLRSVKKKISH